MHLIKFKIVDSPVGYLKIVCHEKAILAVLWNNDNPDRVNLGVMVEDTRDSLLKEAATQLKEYFAKQRKNFDLPLYAQGTPFQKNVWNFLSEIPYGTVCSYKDIAVKMNNPKACRAVGSANGKNPLSIIVPCHRVISTNGKLAGFAGGLDKKQILLNLEKE